MTNPLRIAPSILSADFARLSAEIEDVAPAIEWLHVDVMDGHYVPNMTIGPGVVKCLRGVTSLYLDTHLMIADPRTYAPQFVAAGSDSVTFHPETDDDPADLIDVLHEQGAQVGVALKPAHPLSMVESLLPKIDLLLVMSVEPGFGGQSFMPEVLPKVTEARAWRDEHGADFRIEVDGGIAPDTAPATVTAGADTLVAGSAIFGKSDRKRAVADLEAAVNAVLTP